MRDLPFLSNAFQRLYCDPAPFASFSTFHPISFARVLPYQRSDPVLDDYRLIYAEEAHLAGRSDETRRRLVEAYLRCGLLERGDAFNLETVIDFFDADFFELMGLIYANAGMFRCALRWQREFIRELETKIPDTRSDLESVYASVGYCLYSLGLFEEAITWSKACIGPGQPCDALCQALIEYEAQLEGGAIRAVERAASRTRYVVGAFDPAHSSQSSPRLKAAMKTFAPFQEVYLDWVNQESPPPESPPFGYPFKAELDAGTLPRHKMNLIFATCGRADALIEMGYLREAKRLLCEAALVEPEVRFVRERIAALP